MATRIRYRAEGLKEIKKMIAADDYLTAKNALLAKRAQLLAVLGHPDCDDDAKIELLLTLTNSLLVECCSKLGEVDEADTWLEHTFKHCSESHDPLVRLRVHRIGAMHYMRVERYSEAESEIGEVIQEMCSPAFALESILPDKRLELELAYTRSCKAEILLAAYPGMGEAVDLARQARPILRHGSKRRYELQNLMVCIAGTNRFTSPVSHRRMITRAWYLNEVYQHSGVIRTRLIDADYAGMLVAPLRSSLKRIVR